MPGSGNFSEFSEVCHRALDAQLELDRPRAAIARAQVLLEARLRLLIEASGDVRQNERSVRAWPGQRVRWDHG